MAYLIKRLLRIILGSFVAIGLLPMFIVVWLLEEDNSSWICCWRLVSGQWEKIKGIGK